MNRENIVVTARYQVKTEDLIDRSIDFTAAIAEYVATTDTYIIDLICRQKNLRATIPVSSVERIILGMVLAAFHRMEFDDLLINRDRDGLEKALLELSQMPEIRRSEKLSFDIGVILARLQYKEDFDFLEDMIPLIKDAILLANYTGCPVG